MAPSEPQSLLSVAPLQADQSPSHDPGRDEDLLWALECLRDGTQGSYALLATQTLDGRSHSVLAQIGLNGTEQAALIAVLQDACMADRRTYQDDAPEGIWIDVSGNSFGKLLCLPLANERWRRVIALIGFAAPVDLDRLERASNAARMLLPVLSPYLRLWRRFMAERRRTTGLSSALDQSEISVIILDAAGGTLFTNRSAQALLDEQDGMRASLGTVVASSLRDALRLQLTIEHVISRNRSAGPTDKTSAQILMIGRGGTKRPLITAVVPVETPAEEQGDPAAVIFILKPEQDVWRFLSPVCRMQGLSPVETRLVCNLVSGKTIADAASAMRIKQHTARAYLKQIFLKTDTNRQAELVRLMMGNLLPITQHIVPETVL